MSDDLVFRITPVFGSVDLSSWIDWRDGVGIGMGRRIVRDQDGRIVDISESETGARLVFS